MRSESQRTLTAAPPAFGGFGDGGDDPQAVQADVEAGQRAQVADAGDLVQERAGLVDEQVRDTVPDATGVHRQAAADVGVLRPDQHPPRAADIAAHVLAGDLELTGAVQVPGGGTLGCEQLETQAVGQVVSDP